MDEPQPQLVKDIEQAIHTEVRSLMMMNRAPHIDLDRLAVPEKVERKLSPLFRHGAEARHALRVEIMERQFERIIADSGGENYRRYFARPSGQDATIKLAGVSVYPVRDLPEPGWRIINPFRR